MYEMSQRHPVWITENHVKPCKSAAGKAVLNIKISKLQKIPF
jgi:hypothetical protein